MENKFLATPQPPDIADLTPAQAEALVRAAGEAGFAVFRLDGGDMRDKAGLMEHAAKNLSFPGDFGRNWDAVIDYLGDMANTHKNKKILILVENPSAIADADTKLYADFRDVCGLSCENARYWSRNSVIMKFVFIA